jgi:alanine racemase
MSSPIKNLRTWIEIDKKALEHNLKEFLNIISKKTRLMAVVKSNAYGHGLVLAARALANLQPTTYNLQPRLWFGVDSIVEALRLRREEIKNSILVLGSTLPSQIKEAAENNIILTVSNFDSLAALAKAKKRPASHGRGSSSLESGRPQFHLKVDTGMHRQGFLLPDVPRVIKLLKRFGLIPDGIYTHFAAKDWGYPSYTELQLTEFKKILKLFASAGFRNLVRHAAASDAALLFPEAHLGMVRVGMGLYGYWPSLVAAAKHPAGITLRPVLSWKTVVGEVKKITKGSQVGYDLTEKISRNTQIAVLPVGYWHGYDRGLSSIGEVLIRSRRAKILGRVSMDMIVVDVTDSPGVKVGDEVVLIGKQGREYLGADDLALRVGTSSYKFLTRINPLIKRILI